MEVCVDSVMSAVNAEAGGAVRLELCEALSEGGLTPSVGLLKVVKAKVKIPVFVMIRPRKGMDFIYDENEVNIMMIDVKSLKEAGADGFVFGALTSSRQIDAKTCQCLTDISSPLPCTFHRAFDVMKDRMDGLEAIISLGFQRILTSGQQNSADEGIKLIKKLVDVANSRISIMPGSGVTERNLEFILKETGVKEFHASARTKVNMVENTVISEQNLSMGAADSDFSLMVTDKQVVEKMVKISKHLWKLQDV